MEEPLLLTCLAQRSSLFRRAPRPRCPGLVASFYHQPESTQALRGTRIALGSDSAVLSHRTLGCPSTSPLLVLLVWLQLSMVLPKLWLKGTGFSPDRKALQPCEPTRWVSPGSPVPAHGPLAYPSALQAHSSPH